ncbi:hypothetical protein Glove_441g92 [Diversispora epigaea]|uniref:Attractin/MKLN-like beta-propeller domain-containing protein n=1 Tax=Diversispora epigaea TaxID=1348612 RepID=A0A397GR43_9GLOM|nr:hypothetical protein Glove_441g92 [Diversispora epigaea]
MTWTTIPTYKNLPLPCIEWSANILPNDNFYLDLLEPFDNSNLTWKPKVKLPINTWASTAVASLDNSTIFLIGGYMRNKTLDYDFSNQVYTYNDSTSKWTMPSITGDVIPSRQQIRGVINNSGNIYIFGGVEVDATYLTYLTDKKYKYNGNFSNDMNILNTSSMTWMNLRIYKNLPSSCSDYSANILPDGIIVYIGGQEIGGPLVKMKNIKLFDTNKSEWSQMNAIGGDDIDSRWLFTSVLTSNGFIIIFGGCSYYLTSVSPKLAILNTNKSPYEWTIPDSSKAPSIYGHSANLYCNYMIITFGFDIDNKTYNSHQVYLYDITNNTWVTRFNPPTTCNSTFPSPACGLTCKLLIGFGTGISVVLICVGIFIVHKKRKRNDRYSRTKNSHIYKL